MIPHLGALPNVNRACGTGHVMGQEVTLGGPNPGPGDSHTRCSPIVLAGTRRLSYSRVACEAGTGMVQRVATVAFEGIEARSVTVQVQVAPGLPAFNVVGLGDKAVSEARERVRAALTSSGLALPSRRITVNLAPA